jgi:hypothetical protein
LGAPRELFDQLKVPSGTVALRGDGNAFMHKKMGHLAGSLPVKANFSACRQRQQMKGTFEISLKVQNGIEGAGVAKSSQGF